MKHVILSGLLILTACGKESTGSSSSNSSTYSTGTLTTTSSTALSAVSSWYQSTTEGTYYTGTTARTEYRIVRVNSTTNMTTKVVTPVASGASKAVNSTLASVFSGALGTITNVTTGTSAMGGTIYSVQITKSTGYIYVFNIDTGINSAFNPVYTYDSETKTETLLYQII